MDWKLQLDPEHSEAQLAATVIALTEALKLTVHELAEVKGNADLSWFDDLKQKAVQIGKGTVAENISIEKDASSVRFAFQAVDAAFESLRRGVIEKE
uniref:hypothetical protein n=1 Tax=Brucella pseudintermedia TaxID=370111 RepID=UPI00158AB56A|nr:hypothetical protein [Brucella pseudintermedia]